VIIIKSYVANGDYYKELCSKYQTKRDIICSALSNSGLAPNVPQGAYYVLADISELPGNSSKEKAINLLNIAGIACVPGCAFYSDRSGDNLARFCFSKDDKDIDEACKRLSGLKL
jgi:aminotransferase